jgi:glycerol-3-phosphate O-acyltransferase
VTPTSLATVALLSAGDRALTRTELTELLEDLVHQAEARDLPSTEPLAVLRTAQGITDVTESLAEHGIVNIYGEAADAVYQIAHEQHLAGAFYRNSIIHFFLTAALAEVGLVAAEQHPSQALDAFWDEIRATRDLLKFEFFFAERSEFEEEIHQELGHWNESWQDAVSAGDARGVLDSILPYRAPWVLRSFFEVYLVVAEELAERPIDQPWDEKVFLRAALDRGHQYVALRRLAAAESVSQILFKNALQLAANRSLLEPGPDSLGKDRQTFAAELRRIIDLVDRLSR